MHLFMLAIGLILSISTVKAQTNFPTKKLNVLVLYSDDHSYHALGAAGNPQVLTPNLDKLAKKGMFFTQAHVMGGHQGAVCVPRATPLSHTKGGTTVTKGS